MTSRNKIAGFRLMSVYNLYKALSLGLYIHNQSENFKETLAQVTREGVNMKLNNVTINKTNVSSSKTFQQKKI